MERNGAIRNAKRSHQRLQDGKDGPPSDGNRPRFGVLSSYNPQIATLKIYRFEHPKIRKPLSSLKTPLILRYNFEAPLTLRSSNSASQPGGPKWPADIYLYIYIYNIVKRAIDVYVCVGVYVCVDVDVEVCIDMGGWPIVKTSGAGRW